MNIYLFRSILFSATMFFIVSCGQGSGGYRPDTVTINKNDDTTGQTIPGTPGQSGSNPSPLDTTQARKDSLKKQEHITTPPSSPSPHSADTTTSPTKP